MRDDDFRSIDRHYRRRTEAHRWSSADTVIVLILLAILIGVWMR
jgi:hypothetical protein